MGLTLGHGAWQIDQPSNGLMWNSYSFQPVGQWMGYSFTDLGAEGCCCSLNALFYITLASSVNLCTPSAIVFVSIKARIWHPIFADTSMAAPFCWLSKYPYDPDEKRFRQASRRKLCGLKKRFDKIISVCDICDICSSVLLLRFHGRFASQLHNQIRTTCKVTCLFFYSWFYIIPLHWP